MNYKERVKTIRRVLGAVMDDDAIAEFARTGIARIEGDKIDMKKLINKGRRPTPRASTRLGAVPLGATFVFRVKDHVKEILGSQYGGKMPPYAGQELTVIGFKPRLKNNIVVRDSNGCEYLMPLEMVEKALTLKFGH